MNKRLTSNYRDAAVILAAKLFIDEHCSQDEIAADVRNYLLSNGMEFKATGPTIGDIIAMAKTIKTLTDKSYCAGYDAGHAVGEKDGIGLVKKCREDVILALSKARLMCFEDSSDAERLQLLRDGMLPFDYMTDDDLLARYNEMMEGEEHIDILVD